MCEIDEHEDQLEILEYDSCGHIASQIRSPCISCARLAEDKDLCVDACGPRKKYVHLIKHKDTRFWDCLQVWPQSRFEAEQERIFF